MPYRIARLDEMEEKTTYYHERKPGSNWTEDESEAMIFTEVKFAADRLSNILRNLDDRIMEQNFWYTIEVGKTTTQVFWPTDDNYNKLS